MPQASEDTQGVCDILSLTKSYVLSDSFDVDFGLDSSDDEGNTMSVDG